ncbi:MAG: NAD(P)/FAD-dependent oxidoreductase [Spirochaetales bacterium]|nr:NAD(P)/FAD-dependent oxidoreductase [Spirochaetales bacterium]
MKIGIVGGGMTGLTAGYRLSRQGHTVKIFEKESSVGGLVSATAVNNVRIEDFYHHIFTVDANVVDLIREVGLEDHLQWLEPSNGIYCNNKLYPFTSPMDLLKFRELSFFNRIALGLLVYKAKLVRNFMKLEQVNARDWIIRKAGREVYEKVWGPLIASKFDTDEEKIGSVWFWNKMKLRGSSRTRGVSKEMLGYMRGSFAVLSEKLAGIIRSHSGEIRCNAEVTGIKSRQDKRLAVSTAGEEEVFDAVLVTTPPSLFKRMADGLTPEYSGKLEKIRYKADICVLLELKKRLSPYYWITVSEREAPFVLMLEHTNLITDGRYKNTIVYLSRYCDPANPVYSMKDDEITALFFSYLKKMFPDFNEDQVAGIHVKRALYAQPVIETGYSEIIPGHRTPVDNLFLACMAQIYPEDRGMNYAVRMGEKVATMIMNQEDAK